MKGSSSLASHCDSLFASALRLAGTAPSGLNAASIEADKCYQALESMGESYPDNPDYEIAKTLLVYFIDSMALGRKDAFADKWLENPLATRYGYLNGDERFFDLCRERMSASASSGDKEVLKIALACLRCGFRGVYVGDPGALSRFEQDLITILAKEPRVRIELGHPARPEPLPPETGRRHTRPFPASRLHALRPLLFAVCLAATLVGYFALFRLGVAPILLEWWGGEHPSEISASASQGSP